ncbi:hypothetical protein PR202_ga30795 [Eleusine coracana subsp. coracana]|uniref:Phospholipid/glycerol acyltransferase domain-containing protein n=1 Tax=Eleusine coracana subsp. coracana TaxID=191504 RepID=A0AAV5DPS8_ELECO|nr:hypothetical protein QOZ80_8AG0616430 [Eleusine coracana subsp. coracana]GJN12512.1 hypothetical protein PR202_ga30795 [Eleusine coracana subsp. coracana]
MAEAADSSRRWCTSARSSAASELEGTLLISGSLFPYFFLVALEAGGPVRALALLALHPLLAVLAAAFPSSDLPLLAATFLSTAGLPAADVAAVARATLPRFFLADLRASAFRAFATSASAENQGDERFVVTRLPRVMAEPFVTQFVGADVRVVGTELNLAATGRRFTGGAVAAAVTPPCRHRVTASSTIPLPRGEYVKPLVFHDGRLVARPTPLSVLAIFLWVPLGVILSVTRLLLGFLPYGPAVLLAAATGFRISAAAFAANPAPPTTNHHSRTRGGGGTLYACNHQTLMDPVILSTVLRRRRVTAVTYSLASFSELIAPIPTVRLTRDRATDRRIMHAALLAKNGGDLVVCPEGTTCREPYLLRFSPLFAEVVAGGGDVIIKPTAVRAGGTMFYGSTVRGHKWLDSVFFLMNPAPWYEIRVLEPVAAATGNNGGGGEVVTTSRDVANEVQRVIGDELGFECTGLTRKDKYRMIAGHDGVVDTRRAPLLPSSSSS